MHYPQKIEELIRKLLSGIISPEELEVLNEWYNTVYADEEVLPESSKQKNIRESLWHRLERDMQATEKPAPAHRLRPYLKIAAVLLVLAGLTFGFVYLSEQTHQEQPVISFVEKVNAPGQRSTFQLPDGSRVWLNAGSRLRYPKQFAQHYRHIVLEGEAYFEVIRNENQPFVVYAGDVQTTVLGTAFNIKSFPQTSTTVTVAEGKVQVTPKLQKEDKARPENKVVLTPNQQVIYDPGVQVFEKKEVNPALFLAWKEDTLRFDEIPLKDVAIMLEQWYAVEVTISNEALANCIIVGEHTQESLQNVLEAIQFVLDIEYEINNQKVIIRGRGCT